MSSYMCLTIILLLAVICARAAPPLSPTPAALLAKDEQQEQELEQELTTNETVLEEEQPRIDCKLTFDATMDSLELQQLLQQNGCNVPHTSNTNKPATVASKQEHEQESKQQPDPASVLRHSMSASSSQPIYELQLVVWPTDIEDEAEAVADFVPAAGSTTTTTTPSTTTTTTTTTTSPLQLPLYEDQLVVFPQMDFEEENFDYFFDELEAAATPSTLQPKPTPRPTARPTPTPEGQPSKPVYVLENYRVKYANGTEEHKLVLSNGLVNYMKLYVKRVDGKLINVQEGYNSVPVAGQNPQIQTLYYIADERGYNVYKIENNPVRSSVLPIRVGYKATKAPQSKPKI